MNHTRKERQYWTARRTAGRENATDMSYTIFTDATTDSIKGLSAVQTIPMSVELEGECYSYGPGGNVDPERFYEELRGGVFARTTQISPAEYYGQFQKYLEKGSDILYLCFSSGLSGTYQSSEICMEELREQYPERKILCVDSRSASVGAAVFVHEAAARQAQGMELEPLYQWLTEQRLNICHWFTVEDLEFLKRGGRIGAATAAVGTMLQIKPLLHIDDGGKLEVVSKPRGRKKANAVMLAKMESGWLPEISRFVVIGHAGNLNSAQVLQQEVSARFPDAEIQITEISPIIGAHTGPDMLALGYLGKNR